MNILLDILKFLLLIIGILLALIVIGATISVIFEDFFKKR